MTKKSTTAAEWTYLLRNRPLRLDHMGFLNRPMEDYDFLADALPDSIAAAVENGEFDQMLNAYCDHILRLRNLPLHTESPAFLHCRIECEAGTAFVLQATCLSPCKIWVNGKPVAGAAETLRTVITGYLTEKINFLIVEIPTPYDDLNLSFRLSTYETECRDSPVTLCHQNLSYNDGEADVLYGTANGRFTCLLLARDHLHVDAGTAGTLQISRHFPLCNHASPLLETAIRFSQLTSVNITDFMAENSTEFSYLFYLFTYHLQDGTTRTISLVPPVPVTVEAKSRIKALVCTAESVVQDDHHRSALHYLLQKLEAGDPTAQFYSFCELRDYIDFLKDTDAHNRPGARKLFFTSALDGRTQFCYVRIPPNYDPQKRYPLFLFISNEEPVAQQTDFGLYDQEPCLAASVYGRGITMGSYIGEAAVREALTQVINAYSVDAARIYVAGFSNGGAAAWVQAMWSPQNYAGLLVFAGSLHEPCIQNVQNMEVLHVHAEYGTFFTPDPQKLTRQLRRLPTAQTVVIDEMIHAQLPDVLCKKHYMRQLLKAVRNEFPPDVRLTTWDRRHNCAYWVTIDDISLNKKTASLHAVRKDHFLLITTRNVQAFSLTLPLHKDRSQWLVFINGKPVPLLSEGMEGEGLHFDRSHDGFHPCLQPIPFSGRKGTGLLDVYFDPLSILLAQENPSLRKTAEALSQPHTNGYDPIIQVHYPIYGPADADDRRLYGGSLILLEDLSPAAEKPAESPLIRAVQQHLPIQADVAGCRYKTYQYTGSYCLMQCMPHPWDSDRSVLSIRCNDSSLLQKNLFTRRMTLPGYANGRHPYLNNEALLYTGKEYYRLYEYGGDLTKMDTREAKHI